MAKIMLVEDDTNLSEIYQARLTAEGYDIVSAHDGEEALALAAKEKPDLVISDVMMPKISGFEMLDILRNTEGLKETKVIMLTALGQADDQSRAKGLGADRYLVKSQVTLEDIVKAAQELLSGDTNAPAASAAAASAEAAPAVTPVPSPVPTPVAVAAPPEPQQPVATVPVAAPQPQAPAVAPTPTPAPVAPAPAMPAVPVAPTPVVPVATAPAPQTPAPAPTVVPTPANPVAAPQPQAPAVAPTPTPAPVAPAPPVNTTAAADDQLVTNAVENLEKAAQPTPAPVAQTPAPSPAPGSPAKDDVATTPPASPEPNADNTSNDNVGIAHKKVIQPIDSSDSPKPSLETLLANEERKNPGSIMDNPSVAGNPQGQIAATPQSRVPHQPGHIISPDAAAASPNTGGGIDPNSIAL